MQVKVTINGCIEVPSSATEAQIKAAVEYSVGIRNDKAISNPVDYDWSYGDVDIIMEGTD